MRVVFTVRVNGRRRDTNEHKKGRLIDPRGSEYRLHGVLHANKTRYAYFGAKICITTFSSSPNLHALQVG